MPYNYTNINQIDKDTFDYLKFVLPTDIYETDISEINYFLTKLESYYMELDKDTESV